MDDKNKENQEQNTPQEGVDDAVASSQQAQTDTETGATAHSTAPTAESTAPVTNEAVGDTPAGSTQPDPQKALPEGRPVLSTPFIVAAVIILAAIGGAYYIYHTQMLQGASTGQTQTATAMDTNYPDVVATVNGEDVTGTELKLSVQQIESAAAQQGADISDPNTQQTIQSDALTNLVNAKLLFQQAQKSGITVSSSTVSDRITQLQTQFGGEDKLQAQMKSDGVTMDTLRQNIVQQVSIQQYLEQQASYADITVSDEEISQTYDSYKGQSSSTPPLDQVSDQIKQMLLSKKQQQAVQDIVDGLRTNADIQVKIS